MTKLILGILADDLTGANDTALAFFQQGASASIWVSLPDNSEIVQPECSAHEPRVVTVNTSSRYLSGANASEQVVNTVGYLEQSVQPAHYYKKLDSTLRGNVAVEALALVEALHADAGLIVPAFPAAGRTTVCGVHYLDGVPIAETELARDPLTPITTSSLPGLLEQGVSKARVAHIDLAVVRQGSEALVAAIHQQISNQAVLMSVDAETEVDLETVAQAYGKSKHKLIPCGSAGLAQALSKHWFKGFKPNEQVVLPTVAASLVVAGSHTALTRQQVQQLQRCDNIATVTVPSDVALGLDSLTQVKSLVMACCDAMKLGVSVILTTCSEPSSVDETIALATRHGMALDQSMGMPSKMLAEITKQVLEASQGKYRLVIAGGETAASVCEALGMQQLDICGEIEPAIPWMVSSEREVTLITKSGNLGSENVLVKAVTVGP